MKTIKNSWIYELKNMIERTTGRQTKISAKHPCITVKGLMSQEECEAVCAEMSNLLNIKIYCSRDVVWSVKDRCKGQVPQNDYAVFLSFGTINYADTTVHFSFLIDNYLYSFCSGIAGICSLYVIVKTKRTTRLIKKEKDRKKRYFFTDEYGDIKEIFFGEKALKLFHSINSWTRNEAVHNMPCFFKIDGSAGENS